jgi:hypothetical protein
LVGGLDSGKTFCADQTATTLLKLAADERTGLDDMLSLVSTAVSLLEEERSQKAMIELHGVEMALSVLVESYSRFSHGAESPRASDEDHQLLNTMRNTLIQSLSDVSALAEFPVIYPLNSRLIGSLRMWLRLPHSQLQVCACIMLGNIARSDDICRTLVREYRLHEPLKLLLDESKDSQVLHAAAGILKNLALLKENKGTLGDQGFLESASRLWGMDNLPQVQYAGILLARPLLGGPFNNVRRLLTPLSPDPHSPAHSRTYLSLLMVVFTKTDSVPIRTEIARSITAVLRCLNLEKSDPAEVSRLTELLYRLHPTIVGPLVEMVIQTSWPAVRSEGWFAFALMAKNSAGAFIIGHELNGDALRALVETLAKGLEATKSPTPESSSTSPVPESKVPAIDRENALVLLTELLRNSVSAILYFCMLTQQTDLPSFCPPLFQALVDSKDPRATLQSFATPISEHMLATHPYQGGSMGEDIRRLLKSTEDSAQPE